MYSFLNLISLLLFNILNINFQFSVNHQYITFLSVLFLSGLVFQFHYFNLIFVPSLPFYFLLHPVRLHHVLVPYRYFLSQVSLLPLLHVYSLTCFTHSCTLSILKCFFYSLRIIFFLPLRSLILLSPFTFLTPLLSPPPFTAPAPFYPSHPPLGVERQAKVLRQNSNFPLVANPPHPTPFSSPTPLLSRSVCVCVC